MNAVLELRHRAGLTQALFEGLIGISPATISAYENDHTSPTLEMLERLAKAADLKVEVSFAPLQSPKDRA
jgi:transcriptional regulator with XRE-family HTH domain